MPRCYVKGCTNRYSKDSKCHFFTPPVSQTRDKWFEFAEYTGPAKHIRICSNHFEPSAYRKITSCRPLLQPDAVPTIKAVPVEEAKELLQITVKSEPPDDAGFQSTVQSNYLPDDKSLISKVVKTEVNSEIKTDRAVEIDLSLFNDLKIILRNPAEVRKGVAKRKVKVQRNEL